MIIKKQIFYHHKTYCIHCYLWIGKDNESKYQKFIDRHFEEKRIAPIHLAVNKKYGLVVCCLLSRTKPSYQIENNERKVNLVSLESARDYEIIFRIDPSPDEIKERFMEFDCYANMNDGTEITPLRVNANQEYGMSERYLSLSQYDTLLLLYTKIFSVGHGACWSCKVC